MSLPFGVCSPAILVAVCVVTVSVVPSSFVIVVVTASLVTTVSTIVIGPPLVVAP